MPGGRGTRRIMRWSAAGGPDMPSRCRLPTTHSRSLTAKFCRFTFRWRTIRPNSIARVPILAHNIGPPSSMPMTSRCGSPIVTKLEPLSGFYPAEDYHQDFLVLHPSYPYIVFNDLPKLDNLKQVFPGYYRDTPVTVMASSRPSQ